MSNKEKLREKILKKRKNISNKTFLEGQIFKSLFYLDSIKTAKTVFVYVSTELEIDTKNIINKMLADKTVCVPKVRSDGDMDAVKIFRLSDLKKSELGILEPDGGEIVKKEDIDIAIIPALCFDKDGFRLGYGKGFYDRYLKDYKGKNIGLCLKQLLLNTVYPEAHDIAVDIIVTQDKIVFCKKI